MIRLAKIVAPTATENDVLLRRSQCEVLRNTKKALRTLIPIRMDVDDMGNRKMLSQESCISKLEGGGMAEDNALATVQFFVCGTASFTQHILQNHFPTFRAGKRHLSLAYHIYGIATHAVMQMGITLRGQCMSNTQSARNCYLRLVNTRARGQGREAGRQRP